MTTIKPSANQPSSRWARIRSQLRAEFGEAAYRSWLKPASFEQADAQTVRILAPTRFMRDWIEAQYGERLLKLCAAENSKIQQLEIVHAGAEPENIAAGPGHAPAVARAQSKDDDIGAAGGVEAAIAVLTVAEGVMPPTLNLDTPDPECDLDYVPHHARSDSINAAMSNNLGFGGHNASLIFSRVRG